MRRCSKRNLFTALTAVVLCSGALGLSTRSGDVRGQSRRTALPFDQAELSSKIAQIAAPFTVNKGQFPGEVKFSAHLFSGSFFVTDKGLVYSFLSPSDGGQDEGQGMIVIKEAFWDGENRPLALSPRGEDPGPARMSYFKGRNPQGWQSDIPTYQGVSLGMVYPSIEVKLKVGEKSVEKFFYLDPGSDMDDILIGVEGARKIEISPEGQLVIQTGAEEAILKSPCAYQNTGGRKKEVKVGYEKRSENAYGFKAGEEYDHEIPLIIDPALQVLSASTLIGGKNFEVGFSVALDKSGNVYVAGHTASSDYPASPGGYVRYYQGGYRDVFISKLDGSLTRLLASTFLGGESSDLAFSLIMDASGDVYVTGSTNSTDFPTTSGAYDKNHNGYADVFVSKLNGSLSVLWASTFLGGYNDDTAYSVCRDVSGNLCLTGATYSNDFPTTSGAYDKVQSGNKDAFISKLDGSLSTLVASTYLGGWLSEGGDGIATDASGNIYVAGDTFSSDFPTTSGAYDTTYNQGYDLFLSRLDGSLATLLASTYLGGKKDEYCGSIVMDASGNLYVTGYTSSSNFPTVRGAYDRKLGGNMDAFVSRLNGSLSKLLASTYLGSDGWDGAGSIVLDALGNVCLTGHTDSSDFPARPGVRAGTIHDGEETEDYLHVTRLNGSLSKLLSLGLMKVADLDSSSSLAVDAFGNVYITGRAGSSEFPTTAGAYDVSYNGLVDAYVSKFSGLYSQPGSFRKGFWLLDANGNGVWDGTPKDDKYAFGKSGDIPVTGDWNKDGKTKIGVFREGTWMLDYDGNGKWEAAGGDKTFTFGGATDIPVTGDWNKDGITEIGVFGGGTWMLDYNGNGTWDDAPKDKKYSFGKSAGKPVAADWNGDGKTEIGIVEAGIWMLDYNGNGTWEGSPKDKKYKLGTSADVPVAGDWNGDGLANIGVFKDGTWMLDYNGNGKWDGSSKDRTLKFGMSGDKPVVGKW